jgi:hypothetical protein
MSGVLYRASRGYVAIFYAVLAGWTVGLVPLALSRASALSMMFVAMIAFFTAYSWYWCLGIAYRIALEEDGRLEFTSLRRRLWAHSREVERVEGPALPIGWGFIRFRLERAWIHAFYVETRALRQILTGLRAANGEVRLKNLPRRPIETG